MKCAHCNIDKDERFLTYHIDGVEGLVCQTCRLLWRMKNEYGFREKRLEAQRLSARQKREENPEAARTKDRERYSKMREQRLKNAREWRISNPIKQLLILARARAKKKALEFSLKEADVVWNDFCPILGIKLKTDNFKQSDNSASLDRIDPRLGYVPGNVRVISWRANNLKGDATLRELEALYKDACDHAR